MALDAQRYQVALNVFVHKPLVGFVMDLKPPESAVVQTRLAHVAVDLFARVSLASPRMAGYVAAVFVCGRSHHATLHSRSPRPLALVTMFPVSEIRPHLASSCIRLLTW